MLDSTAKFVITNLGVVNALALVTGVVSLVVLVLFIRNRRNYYGRMRSLLTQAWVPYVQQIQPTYSAVESGRTAAGPDPASLPELDGALNPFKYSAAALELLGLDSEAAQGEKEVPPEALEIQSESKEQTNPAQAPMREAQKKQREIEEKLKLTNGFFVLWSGPAQRRVAVRVNAASSNDPPNRKTEGLLSSSGSSESPALLEHKDSPETEVAPDTSSSSEDEEGESKVTSRSLVAASNNQQLKERSGTTKTKVTKHKIVYRTAARNFFHPPQLYYSQNLGKYVRLLHLQTSTNPFHELLVTKTLDAFNTRVEHPSARSKQQLCGDPAKMTLKEIVPIHSLRIALTHNHRHKYSQALPTPLPVTPAFENTSTAPVAKHSQLNVEDKSVKAQQQPPEDEVFLSKIRKARQEFVEALGLGPHGSVQLVGVAASPFAYFAKQPTIQTSSGVESESELDDGDVTSALVRGLRLGGAIQIRKSASKDDLLSSRLVAWQICVDLSKSSVTDSNDDEDEKKTMEKELKEKQKQDQQTASKSNQVFLPIHFPSLKLAWLSGRKVSDSTEQHFVLVPAQLAVDVQNREIIGALMFIISVQLDRKTQK